jgi:hypothetical protein
MANTPARDVDLTDWLDGIGFKPANTEAKQLGHEAARQLVARLGQTLHYLLPPGRDKSIVFTLLEDVLMRSNKALAVGGGPNQEATLGSLKAIIEEAGVALPEDPRIEQYKAEQRGAAQPDTSAPSFRWSDGTTRPYAETEINKAQDEIEGVRAEQFPRWDNLAQNYDATVTTDDAEIKLEVTSSVASRRVQIGVTSTPERVKMCQDDASRGEGPKFTGFYAGFTQPDHLAAFLREVSAAGEVAFRDGGR